MNRSRVLILLGILLLVGAVAVLVILPPLLTPPPTVEQAPTPLPEIPTTEILVAAQNIPRGSVIVTETAILTKWPIDSLPPADLIITDPEKVDQKIARTDILRGQPILESLITTDPKALTAQGSDASLFIPPGKVAIAFPINKLTSVGYAIGSGDHVDMLVSFSVVDANQEGQYAVVPFNRDLVDELIAAGMDPKEAVTKAIGDATSAQVKPRLLSQLTLQNVEVLHVGEWPLGGILPKPTPTLSPDQQVAQPAVPGGTPTVTPPRPDTILLLLDQQQALILQWLQREGGIDINLVLRAAGDNAPVSTETVSYQYILTSFNITIPPKTNTIIVGNAPAAKAP
jgi:Flp pilus assembly protein CpaB